MKKIFSLYSKMLKATLSLLLISFIANAQEVDMATGMRSSGKIYVVVAVLITIFLGIVIYMISLDRKLRKLEDLIKNRK